MPKEPTDSLEERRLKTRRRLLKIGVYSIPIITTIVASRDAFAACQQCAVKGKTKTQS